MVVSFRTVSRVWWCSFAGWATAFAAFGQAAGGGGGATFGAGIALQQVDGRVIVAQVAPGGGAAAAGVQPGDELLAVDGRAVQFMAFDAIPGFVVGPEGTRVVLTVLRGDQGPWQVEVVRRRLSSAPGFSGQGSQPPPLPPTRGAPAPVSRPAPLAAAGAPRVGESVSVAATADAIRFRRAVIRDPAVNNVESFVFLVPDGWQWQGDIVWMHDWGILANTRLRVVDPRTQASVEYLPVTNFTWFQPPPGLNMPIGGNYMGQLYHPPVQDPAEFVQMFWASSALPHLRGLRPVAIERVPWIAQEYLRQFGGPGEAHGWKLRYEFTRDGRPWEEEVTFGLLFASFNPGTVTWYVNFATSSRAPRGQLQEVGPVLASIVASGQSTPEWVASYRVVKQLFTQGLRQALADSIAFGRKLREHQADIARIRDEVAAERAASQERIAFHRGEALAGVETYRDPVNSQAVSLPAGWNDYWVNDRGEYLLSNQAGMDPNHGSDVRWQRMDRYSPGAR
jgi:hypothetical protein